MKSSEEEILEQKLQELPDFARVNIVIEQACRSLEHFMTCVGQLGVLKEEITTEDLMNHLSPVIIDEMTSEVLIEFNKIIRRIEVDGMDEKDAVHMGAREIMKITQKYKPKED